MKNTKMSICAFFKKNFTKVIHINKSFDATANWEQWNALSIDLFDLVNSYRIQQSMLPLLPSGVLTILARERCRFNIDRVTFNLDYGMPYIRIKKISHAGIDKVLNKSYELGISSLKENLSFGYLNIETHLLKWKESKEHNRILLENARWMGCHIEYDTLNRPTVCLLIAY